MEPMKPMKPMTPMQPMKPLAPIGSAGTAWWPEGLGEPSSAGGQGTLRYAFFPAKRRLVIDRNGTLQQYDTGDHLIQGVSQAQAGHPGTLRFTSQHGDVDLAALRQVD